MLSEASRFGGSHQYKQNKTNKLPSFIDRWVRLGQQYISNSKCAKNTVAGANAEYKSGAALNRTRGK
jgi:hypothetical protein